MLSRSINFAVNSAVLKPSIKCFGSLSDFTEVENILKEYQIKIAF